jgi:hypothetical protein
LLPFQPSGFLLPAGQKLIDDFFSAIALYHRAYRHIGFNYPTVVNDMAIAHVDYDIPGSQQRLAGQRARRDAEDRACIGSSSVNPIRLFVGGCSWTRSRARRDGPVV